jgi:endonuclease/exonuclease/phosphatase family metal-dependent hydrolase
MKGYRKFLYIFLILALFFLTFFFFITIYNNTSISKNFPTPKTKSVSSLKSYIPGKNIKIISYNIHFATGVNNSKINNIDEKNLKKKLDEIAEILINANADVVFLQEVDIDSSRTFRINQGRYLAEKAGFNYYAFSTYWYRKIFPDINGRHGFLNHGLCILSKYPLLNHDAIVFEIPKTIPFFLRWLFNPHGAQKVDLKINNEHISLVNIHLDPWFYLEREIQIKKIINWINPNNQPTIIGGDFNLEHLEITAKSCKQLKDKPWFLKIDYEKLNDEKTLLILQNNNFSASVSKDKYLNNPEKYNTYPSDNPKVKLDYIFINKKFKIIESKVINDSKNASDHLPIYAILKLKSQEKHQ